MRSIIMAGLVLAAGPAIAQNTTTPAPIMPDFGASTAGGRGEAMKVCRADIETLCKGIQPGGGRIAQCVRANYTKLSPVCATALKAARPAK